MKNEDQIVELLAESLRKQDQMIERLDRVENRMKRVEGAIERMATLLAQ
jgi:hypothetical protein